MRNESKNFVCLWFQICKSRVDIFLHKFENVSRLRNTQSVKCKKKKLETCNQNKISSILKGFAGLFVIPSFIHESAYLSSRPPFPSAAISIQLSIQSSANPCTHPLWERKLGMSVNNAVRHRRSDLLYVQTRPTAFQSPYRDSIRAAQYHTQIL
jgi:hypothetical protein